MGLMPPGDSAFPLCGPGDPGGNQKAVPGRRHRQGQPYLKGAGAENQCRAGTLPQTNRQRAKRHPTGGKTSDHPGTGGTCHPGFVAGPLTDPRESEDGNREWDIPVASPEESLSEHISLNQVVARLAPEDRLLIRLRFFAGKTQSETARVLKTTQVQISRRERKILQWMRKETDRRVTILYNKRREKG